MIQSSWIDRIHTRLLVRYGTAWLNMWSGIDQAALKEDWARELDGISPEGLRYGLEHLPMDRPPTAGKFKAICMEYRAPHTPLKELPRPEPTAEQKELVRSMLAKAKASITGGRA